MSIPFICANCGARFVAVGLSMKHGGVPCGHPQAVMPRKERGWPVQYPKNRQRTWNALNGLDIMREDFLEAFGSRDLDYSLDAPGMVLQGSCHAGYMDKVIFSMPNLMPREEG